MPNTTIDRLIINSPYEELRHHWRYDLASKLFDRAEGRRPAGYGVATPSSKAFDDPGLFVEIPLVNTIRPRVKAWREAVEFHQHRPRLDQPPHCRRLTLGDEFAAGKGGLGRQGGERLYR